MQLSRSSAGLQYMKEMKKLKDMKGLIFEKPFFMSFIPFIPFMSLRQALLI